MYVCVCACVRACVRVCVYVCLCVSVMYVYKIIMNQQFIILELKKHFLLLSIINNSDHYQLSPKYEPLFTSTH